MSKIWRAFPELDRFDDRRCRGYVREAQREHWRSGLLVLSLIPLAIVGWLISMSVSIGIMDLLYPGGAGPGPAGLLIALALFAGSPLALAVGVLLARDRWLRRAVRGRLNVARCLGCSYSLLGLTPLDGGRVVICPECGREGELTDEMLEQMRELGSLSTPSPPSSP